MKCKWILENDVFDEGLDRLTSALDDNGNPYNFVKYFDLLEQGDNADYGFLPENGATLFYGSLNLAKHIQRKTRFAPGSICNLDNFKYTTYAPHYGHLLLNSDWFCLPLREAVRRRDFIFSGEDQLVFVRPNNGDKDFAGGLYDWDHFNLDNFGYKFSFHNPDILIIISPAKLIGKEIRYFIGDRVILSSSEYGQHNRRESFGLTNPDVFVEDVLKTIDWEADPVYNIDICEAEDGWKITELNSFSCSGIYNCDPLPIVKKVSEIAERMWSEDAYS